MEPARFSDPSDQLNWIIDTQGLDATSKLRLTSIKTSIAVLNERHEEVMREKERKILTLEFQLIASTRERVSQGEKMKQLEKEKRDLNEENIGLKEGNSSVVVLRDLIYKASGLIEEQDHTIHNLEVKVDEARKKLKLAMAFNRRLQMGVETLQRKNRRVALKLLSSLMESDGDVAIPEKQRPVSERGPSYRTSSNSSKLNVLPTNELQQPRRLSNNGVSPFTQDSDESDDALFPILPATTPHPSLETTHCSEATVHVHEHWRRLPQKKT